jgi:uncharacterized membrane protein YcaP (DUF421 family)
MLIYSPCCHQIRIYQSKARIGIKEFEFYMRSAGIRDVSEIEQSNLEINGQVSFIKKDRR